MFKYQWGKCRGGEIDVQQRVESDFSSTSADLLALCLGPHPSHCGQLPFCLQINLLNRKPIPDTP